MGNGFGDWKVVERTCDCEFVQFPVLALVGSQFNITPDIVDVCVLRPFAQIKWCTYSLTWLHAGFPESLFLGLSKYIEWEYFILSNLLCRESV